MKYIKILIGILLDRDRHSENEVNPFRAISYAGAVGLHMQEVRVGSLSILTFKLCRGCDLANKYLIKLLKI